MSLTFESDGVVYQPTYSDKSGGRTKVNLRGSVPGKRKVTYRSRRNNLTRTVKDCMLRLAERKHTTTSLNIVPTLLTGTIGSTVILSQGTTAFSRIGQQVHLTEVEYFLEASVAAASAGDSVRFILAVDHQPDGANPSVNDVLESTSYIAPYNKDKVGSRFRILTDRFIEVQDYAASVTTRAVTVRGKHKLNLVTFYQSNAGTISDLLRNNLFYIVISKTGNSNFGGNIQVCYKDL